MMHRRVASSFIIYLSSSLLSRVSVALKQEMSEKRDSIVDSDKKRQDFLITFSLYLSSPCQLFSFCATRTLTYLICSPFPQSSHFSTSCSELFITRSSFFSKVHPRGLISFFVSLYFFFFFTASTSRAPSPSSYTGRAMCAPAWRSTSTSLSTILLKSTSLWLSRRPAPSKVGPTLHPASQSALG